MGAARGCVAPAAAGLLSDTVAMDKGRATRGLESSLGDNIASAWGGPIATLENISWTREWALEPNGHFSY